MRLATALAVTAGSILMAGCGPVLSIHPLYTQANLVSDLPLEGSWAQQDNRQLWQVHKSGDGYEVIATEASDAASVQKFDVHLLRLNEFHFLDIASQSPPDLAISGHLFAKIWMAGPDLRVALIDSDWMAQMMEAGVAPQAVTGPRKQIILTAPTSELQKFVSLYALEPKAFDADPGDLHPVQ